MLTLKAPIQLHIAQNLTGNAEAFGQRIRGNYSLMGAHFAAKDLLFLMTAPPELPDELGGMTTIVNQENNVDVRSVTMDVVNNVVNRILLDGSEQFTYQDQVYLTTVLNRLGVTNTQEFVNQVRQLRIENESTVHMTRLYREELERVMERQAAGEPAPALPLPARPEEENAPRPHDPRTELSLEIFNRLDAARLYETIHAFQRSWTGGAAVFRNQEFRLSEQLRLSNTLALNEVKQQLYARPEVRLTYYRNAYETGGAEELPQNEEQVLAQAAAAALANTVDNTVVQVLNRPELRREQWIQVQNALWQTAEQTLSRFESYHSQPQPPENLSLRTEQTWNRYVQELRAYQTLRQSLYPKAAQALPAAGTAEREMQTRLTFRTAETEREETLWERETLRHETQRHTQAMDRTRAELLRQILGEQSSDAAAPAADELREGEPSAPVIRQAWNRTENRPVSVQRQELIFSQPAPAAEEGEEIPLFPPREGTPAAAGPESGAAPPSEQEQQLLRETILRQLRQGSVPGAPPPAAPAPMQFVPAAGEAPAERETLTAERLREQYTRQESYTEHERRRDLARNTVREVLRQAVARPGSTPPPDTVWTVNRVQQAAEKPPVRTVFRDSRESETEQTRLEALTQTLELRRLWTRKPSLRTERIFRDSRETERERTLSHTETAAPPPRPGASGADLTQLIGLEQRAEPVPPPAPIPPLPLTAREAEEQDPERLREEITRIDRHNRTILQAVQAQEKRSAPPQVTGPDLARTMRDGLRALEHPEQVLREVYAARETPEEAPRLQLTAREEALLQQADPETRAVYEAVLAYQKDPQQAIAQGLLRPEHLGALHGALKQAEQPGAPLELEHPGPGAQAQRELLREQSEAVLERFQHLAAPPRQREPEAVPPPAVKIVHKQAAPDVTEELLEQLNQQRTQTTVQNESREDVTRRQSHQVDVNHIERKVVAQTTEDITELVNRTLARQMRSISDQVYRQMEKRLQTERSRRGRW